MAVKPSVRPENVWQLQILLAVSSRADTQLLILLAFLMASAFRICWWIYHVFGVPQRLWCCVRAAFGVDLIWCEGLLVLILLLLWRPSSLYNFPICLQLFSGNSKDVPKECYSSALLFWVIARLIKCHKMSIFLSLVCPGKRISKWVWVIGMKICVAAYFLTQ